MVDVSVFDLVWTGFSLLFVGFGLVIVHSGRKMRQRSKRIEGTETTPVRELSPGTVEVKGTARPTGAGDGVDAPISEGEALVTTVEVEKYDSGGEGGGRWKTLYEDEEAVPFLVEDGTGQVRVDPPTGGLFEFELEREKVGGGEEPPEAIRRFVESEAGVDEAARHDLGLLSVGERRRYSEGLIRPGEEVYVLGEARETDGGWGEHHFVVDGGTDPESFVLSDKSEEKLVSQNRWGGVLLYALGALFAGMGLLFVAIRWVSLLA